MRMIDTQELQTIQGGGDHTRDRLANRLMDRLTDSRIDGWRRDRRREGEAHREG